MRDDPAITYRLGCEAQLIYREARAKRGADRFKVYVPDDVGLGKWAGGPFQAWDRVRERWISAVLDPALTSESEIIVRPYWSAKKQRRSAC